MTTAAVIGRAPTAAAVTADLLAAGWSVALVVSPPREDPELPDWADPSPVGDGRWYAERRGLPWADLHRWEPHLLPPGVDVVVAAGDAPDLIALARATSAGATLGGMAVSEVWAG